MNSIQQFLQELPNNINIVKDITFQQGLIAGIILAILLLLVLKFICFTFRAKQKRVNGILANGDGGEVFVSTQAISSLIKSLEADYPGVIITKTTLFSNKKLYTMKLNAELRDKDASFPSLVDSLRNSVITSMGQTLGIETIEKIDIQLKKVKF